MHTHHLQSHLPPPLAHVALQGHAPLTVGGKILLAALVLILMVGSCTILTLAWEAITTATRWLVRIISQRISKGMDHE